MYKEAIPRFTLVIKVLPDLALGYHGRGLAYYHQEIVDLALDDFDKAIELDPDFAAAYRNRGVVYGNEGEIRKAIADLEKALELFTAAGKTEQALEVQLQLRGVGR